MSSRCDLGRSHMFKFHATRPATYTSNGSELYLPLYIDWRHLEDVPLLPLFTILLELEVVLLILSASVNTLLAVKMWRTSLVHANLKIVYFTHLLEYYAFFCAQLILMCYQVGWIWIGYDTTDDFLLIACSLAKMQRMWSACLIVVASVVERTIATWRVDRYEQSKPRAIGFIVAVLKTVVSVYLAYLLLFTKLTYWTATFMVITILGSSLAWLTFLEHQNKNRLAAVELLQQRRSYSLSQRYQLQENARVFKVIRSFVYIIVTNIAVSLTFLNIATKLIPHWSMQPYVVLFMEYLLVGTPVLVVLAMKQRLKEPVDGRTTRSPSRFALPNVESTADETHLHFLNLKELWA